MHGSVGRKENRPASAARRPDVSVHHGVELRDDYAWLRATNWQDVMRDPSLLDAEIRAYLEAGERLLRGRARRHAAASGNAVLRDEGPPQAGRQHRSDARRRLRLLFDLRRRRPVPAPSAVSRAAAETEDPAPRRQRRGRGQALLGPRRAPTAPTTSCWPTPSTTRARSCSPSAFATWRPARISPTRSPTPRRDRVVERRAHAVLHPRRCQPPPALRLPPPHRHASQR